MVEPELRGSTAHRVPCRRRPIAGLLALACGLLLAGCGAADDDEARRAATPTEGLTVVSIPKQLDNPYEEIEQRGVRRAVEELGGESRIVGATDASAASQIPLIGSVAEQRPDALIIAGTDADAVAPALRQAAERGVKVVSMDSDVARDARAVFVNQAEARQIGRDQVRILAEQVGDEGEIAILSATATATNQNAWIAAMKDELRRHPGLRLVKVAYGDDDDQRSYQETQGLVREFPRLKGIIAPTAVGIAAAARYLSGSRWKEKVALTGLGTPRQLRRYVDDGTVEEFALWNPEDVGYLAGHAAAALASGEITGAAGETFRAGKLGVRTIGRGGEVVLGPPLRFNAGNVRDFGF
ncbi:MAG TPA: rhamnose ABC transporter substrate-binding protein [Solirubrobacteraceae bacterium]|nr:rhamnose ABC transporter substrate-binding protein [Solirubrobacteraceae bacterium]